MRALVVDDSETIRKLLVSYLKEAGVNEIVEAPSADLALAKIQTMPNLDLILTDWHMPGMTGIDFLQLLRAMPRFKSIPIVMTTSESSGENVVAALRAGATNYVIKPFSKSHLLDRIGPIIKATLAAESAPKSETAAPVAHAGMIKKEGELGEVLQFFVQSRKTGCCEIDHGKDFAKIYFRDGNIVGAEFQILKAELAFYTCFGLYVKGYRFIEESIAVRDGCSIATPTTTLLLEAVARLDHARR